MVWDKVSLASLIESLKQLNHLEYEINILHLNHDFELEEDHAITNDSDFEQAIEELMLVEEAGEAFDNDALLSGDLHLYFSVQL